MQTCRGCGACAPDLAALPEAAGPVVAGDEYRAIKAPPFALPFLRAAKLMTALGDHEAAAQTMLQAAWAFDDLGDEARAAECRRRAAELWAEPPSAQLVDIRRRAGDFDAAAETAAAITPRDPAEATLLGFQSARISERDAGRHLMSSALPPPAQRPHVTQTQAPARSGGLFRRLFGGGE